MKIQYANNCNNNTTKKKIYNKQKSQNRTATAIETTKRDKQYYK